LRGILAQAIATIVLVLWEGRIVVHSDVRKPPQKAEFPRRENHVLFEHSNTGLRSIAFVVAS
jgi:hypothetical protein